MADQLQITVFQHYIPQTWLKRFTYNKNKTSVFAYDTENNIVIGSKNIKNIAGEKYFYDFSESVFNELLANGVIDPVNEKQLVETNYLANNIEDKLGKIFKDLFEKLDDCDLNTVVDIEDLKILLSIHFSILYFRGTEIREHIRKISQVIVRITEEDSSFDSYTHKVEDELSYFHFLMMRDSKPLLNLAETLVKGTWVFYKIENRESFVIGDNPFVFEKGKIIIPLSSKYILISHREGLLPDIFNLGLININSNNFFSVDSLNNFQYHNSSRDIYSSTDEFERFKKIKKNKDSYNIKLQPDAVLKNNITALMNKKINVK